MQSHTYSMLNNDAIISEVSKREFSSILDSHNRLDQKIRITDAYRKTLKIFDTDWSPHVFVNPGFLRYYTLP